MTNPRILVVDDDRSMREILSILLTREGCHVETQPTAEAALRSFTRDPHDLVITDLNLPGQSGLDLLRGLKTRVAEASRDVPVILITAYGTAETAVEAMKNGAFDYVLKPFSNDELKLLVRRALEQRRLREENLRLKQELQDRYHFGTIIGSSPAMRDLYGLIERVKDTRISCLLTGESGTGKELVARAIHYSGVRSDGPFIAINCGAIPETLIESELFGYRKGAFTGADRDREGLFEAANGGTLLLDEIGDMPLITQVKTLRAIQERRVTPVGGTVERSTDVRIVAATNKDLESEVHQGRFREDLYYRLNVVSIHVPPLRARGDDILELARHFLGRYAEEYGKDVGGFTPEALRLLKRYEYPGNVRELQNIVERAVALSAEARVGMDALPERLLEEPEEPREPTDEALPPEGLDLDARLAGYERYWLLRALEESGGNKTRAAELLNMSFRSFRYRLDKHRITID